MVLQSMETILSSFLLYQEGNRGAIGIKSEKPHENIHEKEKNHRKVSSKYCLKAYFLRMPAGIHRLLCLIGLILNVI